MSEIIGLFTGSVWPWLIGVVGLVLGGALWKAKRADTKAQEAIERAEEAERQVQEAQGTITARERATEAVEKVRKKPLKKPSPKRDDFESQ